ncbi:hypothetical protein A2899_05300 [Candidatus Amesbacteria bacterium RIFCSPLOWO2_01_FULL_49_25]|nr:MAG: hypothetical protein A2899_05300 [Candidatus Amesbacteria bacterium RIFCSPLOWO2_01_FULL_49_25]
MPLLVILIFSLTGLSALLHPGLFTAHDIWHNVARLYHYYHTVRDGQFPPYWISSMAQGFGYPLFFFSYHLPWLVGLPLLLAGLSIPTVTKLLFYLPYFLSGLTFYISSHLITKNRPASLIGSILYLWAPHRFLVTLVSASTGVAWTFVFIPLYLSSLYLILSGSHSQTAKLFLPVGLSGLILSHLLTTLTLAVPTLVLILINIKKISTSVAVTLIVTYSIGLLLSSFYLLPSLYYSRLTRASAYKQGGFATIYQTGFVNFRQLIYSKWGYGPVKFSAKDGEISYQVGLAQWASVFLLLIFSLRPSSHRPLIFGLLISYSLSVFLIIDPSRPIWDFVEKFISLDYPARFLVPATYLASLSASLTFIHTPKSLHPLLLLLIPLALYTNRNHIRVNLYTDVPLKTYIDSEATTSTHNEYFPAQAAVSLLNRPAPPLDPPLPVSNFSQGSIGLSFSVATSSATQISLRQIDFPGQHVYLDNQEIPKITDSLGRLSLTLPPGSHTVSTRFLPTLLIKFSWALTTLGLVLLFKVVNARNTTFARAEPKSK